MICVLNVMLHDYFATQDRKVTAWSVRQTTSGHFQDHNLKHARTHETMATTKTHSHSHANTAMMHVLPVWQMGPTIDKLVHQIITCNQIAIHVAKLAQMEHTQIQALLNEPIAMQAALLVVDRQIVIV